MAKSKLPTTDSIEELAEFWDAHDSTDFEDEFEIVTEPVFVRRKSEAEIKISLKFHELELLAKLAKSKGVEQDTLIREWVLEKLRVA